jgi:hypothetical protein
MEGKMLFGTQIDGTWLLIPFWGVIIAIAVIAFTAISKKRALD